MLKIIQHNLNRDRTASPQLRAACRDLRADFVLVQEPLVTNSKIYAFERCKCHISKKSGAAVIALSDRFQCIGLNQFTSDYTAAANVTYSNRPCDYVVLVSSYFKYNVPTITHLERLEQILSMDTRALIAADTNGHSPRWHSTSRNRRGRLTEQMIEKHNLCIHNSAGQMNTFCRRDGRTSNIDVTLSTENIKNTIKDWSVSDLTDSDHRVIAFTIKTTKYKKLASHEKRYILKTADWDKFNTALLGEIGGISESSIESTAMGINRALSVAAD